MGLPYDGRLLLEPEERKLHRNALTNIAQKKIFEFMMIVTFILSNAMC